MLRRVISGGQVGADIAGLRAAYELRIETGGHMPRGFLTKHGKQPDYADLYGVVETSSGDYPERTAMNVREADATIRIAHNFGSPGERLTKSVCIREKRPIFDVTWDRDTGKFDIEPEAVAEWIEWREIEILNVAGNATKELEVPAYEYLLKVFKLATTDDRTDDRIS